MMTILEKFERQFEMLRSQVEWLKAHPAIAALTYPASMCGSKIDFDWPDTREAVQEILNTVAAGQWTRTTNGVKVNYETVVDGMTLRIYSAPPPPSCEVVFDDVEMPAQPARVEKRARLVCSDTVTP